MGLDGTLYTAVPPIGPSARSTDPQTSHEAAEFVRPKAGTQRARVMDHLIGVGQNGTTDERAIEDTGMNPSSYRGRRADLVQLGLVEQCGFSTNSSGCKAIVWRITLDAALRLSGGEA